MEEPAASAAEANEGNGKVADEAPATAGEKRKLLTDEEEPAFKVPPSPKSRAPSSASGSPSKLQRPPLLMVDTSLADDVDSPALPQTPANVRMNNPTELHRAVLAADVTATKTLLEDCHAVDPIEEHGFTPLHKASALVKSERPELVRLLLDHRADACLGDHEGYTPLHWASALGHSNVVDLLLEAGASVNQRSGSGESALHRASRFGQLECARKMIASVGLPSLSVLNHDFLTPLDVAGQISAKRVNRQKRLAIRRMLLEACPAARTLVLHHPDCLLHDTGDGHQEHPLRLDAILAYIHAMHPPTPPASGGSSASASASASANGSGNGSSGAQPKQRHSPHSMRHSVSCSVAWELPNYEMK